MKKLAIVLAGAGLLISVHVHSAQAAGCYCVTRAQWDKLAAHNPPAWFFDRYHVCD